jgi:hypothetical protein
LQTSKLQEANAKVMAAFKAAINGSTHTLTTSQVKECKRLATGTRVPNEGFLVRILVGSASSIVSFTHPPSLEILNYWFLNEDMLK